MRNKHLAIVTFSASTLALAVFAVCPFEVSAATFTVTSTFSGSGAQVPIDLDGKNCGPVNGVTTCPADSFLGTFAGTASGGPGSGPFTAQSVVEDVPMPGTGCSFAPTTIQSCTIGSVTDGCLFVYVGGNGVTRVASNGDLSTYVLTSGSLCINFDTALPWSFEGQQQWEITGGTGKAANAGGSFTSTFQGQILQNDPQGHGFSWSSGSSKGTLILP